MRLVMLLIIAWRVLWAGWPLLVFVVVMLWLLSSAGFSLLDLLLGMPLIFPLAIAIGIAVLAGRALLKLMEE